VYDYITEWRKQQTEVLQNHKNANQRDIEQGGA
jgi:hypothetical protein